MKLLNFQSQNVFVDWISFNIQGLPDPLIIARRLSKHFTSHVLMDYVPSIGFHGFKKSIRFLSINTQDQRVTGLGLKLFFLVKMLITFIHFSKLGILIGVF